MDELHEDGLPEPAHGDGQSVDALTPSMVGVWLVKSNGTDHYFDLDRKLYWRHPGEGRKSFPGDGRQMPLTFVERWPHVGATFFIWLDDPDVPHLVEYWRQSSPIRSITAVTDQAPRPESARSGDW